MKKLVILILVFGFWACKVSNKTSNSIDNTKEEILVISEEPKTGEIDEESGFIIDENLPIIIASCTPCHSAKLVTQNRFDRKGWKEKIVWMQKTQNLWDLGETEKPILDYLEKYYSPSFKGTRRAPLENIEWYKL